MEYRKLGKTDLDISLIGLGTMTWGWQNTQAEGFEQMDYALEQGVNFFDTAEMYAIPPSEAHFGTTETIIGNWFESRSNRDKVVLASKITGPGFAWLREGNNRINKVNILDAVEGSLKRLKTDYIDLYQLHWPNRGSYHFGKTWGFAPDFDPKAEEENFLEVLNTFKELIKQGKIRHIGLSNETAWGMTKWLQLADQNDLPRMASIQNEYSLLCRHFEPDLAEIAIHEQCGLLAWSPLARGILSGKYLNGALPEGARLTLETRPEHRKGTAVDSATQQYIALAQKHDLDPCQMALAFVNSRPFVSSNLIGATTMEQLKSNIESISVTLSDEVLAGIEHIRRTQPVPF
ncbi:aldo/keto reductase [Alkalimarinus sediminis]|uniref:Aldo/keto reductase n=1 Tax=Alkalimarinus sediminis TaxID=1632866 RepID=A0A9E8HJV3_9ALTE|nr:aldo/keto reductase [Alkalimarinus sediminis]UZW75990.1 aldo/keto reductase [Alkalimarinus sediminis]